MRDGVGPGVKIDAKRSLKKFGIAAAEDFGNMTTAHPRDL